MLLSLKGVGQSISLMAGSKSEVCSGESIFTQVQAPTTGYKYFNVEVSTDHISWTPLSGGSFYSFDASMISGSNYIRTYLEYSHNTGIYQIFYYRVIFSSDISSYGSNYVSKGNAQYGNASFVSYSSELSITVNPLPTAGNISGANQVCEKSTITTTANATGGIAPYTIEWSSSAPAKASVGPSTGIVTGISAGSSSITYTVTDSKGCISPSSAAFSVTVNPTPAVNSVTPQEKCNGSNSDLINFTSAISGSTFSWTNNLSSIGISANGSGSSIASALLTNSSTTPSVATFNVTPTANGCVGTTSTFTITVNPTPAVNSVTPQEKCNGSNSDLINFTSAISGSTFSWTNNLSSIGISANGSGSSIASALLTNSSTTPSVATFNVTPTANGCVGTTSTFTITVNPTPAVNSVTPQEKCNGSNSDLINFTSAISGSTFSWTNNLSSIGISANGSGSSIASALLTNSSTTPSVATFNVTPTANGCVGTTSTFTITVNPTPAVNSVTPQEKCNGSNSDLINFTSAISGSTFSWTNNLSSIGISANGSGSSIASALLTNSSTTPSVATFNVTPTANGCVGTTSTFTITVNPTPAVNSVTPQEKCNGSNSDLINFTSAISGSTFSWTNNLSSIGISANGSGSSIASALLTNSSTTPSVATFNVTPTANGCVGTTSTFTITVNPTPAVNSVTPQEKCNGSNSDLINFTSAISGSTFSWTNNLSSIGISANGSGSSIASALLTNSSTTPSVATFNVTPTANGCVGTTSTFTITVNPTPAVNSVTPQEKCNGSNSDLINFTSAISGSTFSWTNNLSSIGISANGSGSSIASALLTNSSTTPSVATFNVTPTANGCVGTTSTFTITVNPTPSAPTAAPTTVCYDGAVHTADASAGAGESVVWYTANTGGTVTTQPSATSAGTITKYALAQNNSTSCVSATRTSVSLIINALPSAPTVTNKEYCLNETASALTATSLSNHNLSWYGLNASGGSSSTSAPIPLTNSAGSSTYYVSQTNTSNACESPRAGLEVVIKALPPTPTITSNSPVCEGASLTLNAANISGAVYFWEGANGFTSSLVNPTINNVNASMAGNYSLKIKFNGCVSPLSNPISVLISPTPTAPTVTSNSPIEEGNNLMLTASNLTGATYAWTGPNSFISNQQNPNITGVTKANEGNYYAAVTLNGCSSVNSLPVNVVVNAKVITSPVFQIPNAFTPNNDGHNDTFKIIQNGYVSSIVSFKIFTKAGKLIFSDKEGGWDGRYGGVMLDADVYIWIADIINKNNIQEHYTGPVLLLK